jgi:hypothetical protein
MEEGKRSSSEDSGGEEAYQTVYGDTTQVGSMIKRNSQIDSMVKSEEDKEGVESSKISSNKDHHVDHREVFLNYD